MVIFRRRLIYWLIKAYFKRWGKVIFFSFLFGLLFFFILASTSRKILELIPFQKKATIGVVGAYTVENLPSEIVSKVSRGLTKVDSNGKITPDLATNWRVMENGKLYEFKLNENIHFSDGKQFTSRDVVYSFSDVKIERPDSRTVRFALKDEYSPFLVTVSRPILKKGSSGIGEYSLADIELNGNFVKSMQIVSSRNKFDTEQYQFYPSEEAVKLAFALGEVDEIRGLTDVDFQTGTFRDFKNVTIEKSANHSKLVTIFYDTTDPILSDKKIRNGLTYALPDTFPQGERSIVSYPPDSQYRSHEALERNQDITHAKALIDASSASESAEIEINLSVLEKYKSTADVVAKEWEKAGVKTKITIVPSKPDRFQAFLGDFTIPRDPDQYTLWHSGQANNITKFRNLRIDKLLEDGRRITNVDERKQIYTDFQKYLLDDSPASFLYFPYSYTVTRK
jgi:peptide/nickel transport system substrate-binding protein